MDQIKDGWFTEKSDLWPGQCTSLQVQEVLYAGKSAYQDIQVLKTTHHGAALILDGIIQCTERDEFAYQEMITWLPLCVHPRPERVLIVGGGDGGVAREVSKHPHVLEIVQVEIDAEVVAASRKHLPFMARGFDSPKLSLEICDGFEYLKTHASHFDVIITDSSDPVGPAENLFTSSYFGLLKRALRAGGVVCSQGGTIWAGLEHVRATLTHCRGHFAGAQYALASVPTYPTGQIGFIVGTLDSQLDLTVPKLHLSAQDLERYDLKYYNSDIHKAAFTLPNFARSQLNLS